MYYGLPTTMEVGGVEYGIRTDYRVIMDIYAALNDPDLEPDVRAYEVLHIFYEDADAIPDEYQQEAVDKCLEFLQGGTPRKKEREKQPKLIDWEQDFHLIAAPVNRVMGCEVRSLEYLHWWSFLAAYNEIGDCFFAQIVAIRSKKAKGKPLDKQDREFYRQNRELVDLKTTYTSAESEVLNLWLGK